MDDIFAALDKNGIDASTKKGIGHLWSLNGIIISK